MSEFENLQERVDAIHATGDTGLVARAYRALSKVLFEFTRQKTGRTGSKTPIMQRVTSDDVQSRRQRPTGSDGGSAGKRVRKLWRGCGQRYDYHADS